MNKKSFPYAIMAAALAMLWTTPAWAMHISEGILPATHATGWFLACAPFFLWGVRSIERRKAQDPSYSSMVALVGAAIFVISCMPVPLPSGTCSHACGTGLGAILIGPGATIIVAAVALLLQALFLAHGGLTTLGADLFSMGVVGALSAYGVFHSLRRCRVSVFAAAVAAGIVSDWATYATTSLQLAGGLAESGGFNRMFAAIALAFVPTQLPLGIVEGILSAMAYRFVLERRPELLFWRQEGKCAAGERS